MSEWQMPLNWILMATSLSRGARRSKVKGTKGALAFVAANPFAVLMRGIRDRKPCLVKLHRVSLVASPFEAAEHKGFSPSLMPAGNYTDKDNEI